MIQQVITVHKYYSCSKMECYVTFDCSCWTNILIKYILKLANQDDQNMNIEYNLLGIYRKYNVSVLLIDSQKTFVCLQILI